MINLSQHGLSHQQIERLLRTDWRGSLGYRVDLVRDNTVLRKMDVINCSYQCESAGEIKYGGSVTAYHTDFDNNYDMVQPVIFIEDGELFEFKFPPLRILTPKVEIKKGVRILELEAMDNTCILKNTSIGYPLYLKKGEVYTTVVERLIREVGFPLVEIHPDDRMLTQDREEWDASTKVLDIVNTLLGEINYKPIEIDLYGVPQSEPYPEETGFPSIYYRADGESIVFQEKSTLEDSWGKANIFRASVFTQEMDVPISVEYINDNPDDPTSTQNNPFKQIHVFSDIDNVADQQTLYDIVFRRAKELSSSYEYATLRTAIMPHHGTNEVIFVESEGVDGIWQETGWAIDDFSAKGNMTHSMRRVIR